MFQENEIIRCFLMLGVSLFILINQRVISQIPHYQQVVLAFLLALLGTFFSVIEGVQHPALFNILEHLSSSASLVVLCIWMWRVCGTAGD